MMKRLLLPLVLAIAHSFSLHGQASSTCQVRPKSLAAMRHCYRPLLVFSPAGNDPRLKEQTKILDQAADDMMDRFVMLTPIVPDAAHYATPLDTPYIVFSEKQMNVIRAQFHIPTSSFAALLLDEDGSVMLRSDKPIAVTKLNGRIDITPQRKVEERRKDSY